MTYKTLIAAAAVAASMSAFAPAPQAQAGVDIDVNLGLGYPGYYPGYYPVYDYDDGMISCKKGRWIVKNHNFNNVKPIDCSLPKYQYTGWKFGQKYKIRVSGHGDILSVKKMW